MRRLLRSGVAAIAALMVGAVVAPTAAGAAVIVWTLHNVDFGSADPVTGSFTIDTVKGIQSVNISSAFGGFSKADVQGGNPLDLSDGVFLGHSLLLQQQYSLVTNIPSQLADNPLFGGSDIDGFTELTLNTKDGPYISGVIQSSAPEPATWALTLIGLGGLGAALRSARRKEALAPVRA